MSRNGHDAAGLTYAPELGGEGLGGSPVAGRPHAHAVQLPPARRDRRRQKRVEAFRGHIVYQTLRVLLAHEAAELHGECSALRRTATRRWSRWFIANGPRRGDRFRRS